MLCFEFHSPFSTGWTISLKSRTAWLNDSFNINSSIRVVPIHHALSCRAGLVVWLNVEMEAWRRCRPSHPILPMRTCTLCLLGGESWGRRSPTVNHRYSKNNSSLGFSRANTGQKSKAYWRKSWMPLLQHPPPRPPPAAQEEDLSEEEGLDRAIFIAEEWCAQYFSRTVRRRFMSQLLPWEALTMLRFDSLGFATEGDPVGESANAYAQCLWRSF